MKPHVEIYDTTLRDGAQGEGISFSGVGKILVAKRLDEFGVDYIEGGYAASNPKDMEFFHAIRKEKLKHAKIAAFGSTRRANVSAAEDAGCKALIEADTPVCTIFGKSWRLHVKEVLRTTEDENRAMIADTVRFLKEHGREVIYDAEHFFDGFADSREHALSTLRAAYEAGADRLVLCDTNGGTLPERIAEVVRDVQQVFPDAKLGIHTHNDSELGVANSLAAVAAGARHVQGTINGFGERVGNANLVSIVPSLVLKMGYACIQPENLKQLKAVSQFVDEMANVRPNTRQAFVGDSAFAHKAGMHVDGVRKLASSFEHIKPESVGNQRRILISELSGASNVFLKAVEMGLNLDKNSAEVKQILRELEGLEKKGYAFEAAEASFKLLIQKVLKKHKSFFNLISYRVTVDKFEMGKPILAEATVKLSVNGDVELTVGEGGGPVDALNNALRKALGRFYSSIKDVSLVDYQVRILDPEEGTGAKTRVLIESTDGKQSWGTVGVSANLIEASWEALVDSVEYKLFLEENGKK
ncbi:MAG: citramalate synthase [Kiritimatiellae bacterium]|nr:citramalate synthase [Kiritimatiellia bacterium]